MSGFLATGVIVLVMGLGTAWFARPEGRTRRRRTLALAGGHELPTFRKSSYSVQGNCVEVALISDSVLIRDSKQPGSGVLRFAPDEWQRFVGAVRSDDFERTSP